MKNEKRPEGLPTKPTKPAHYSKGEIEHNLLYFAMLVEEGRTPPPSLLRFMAEGARAMLKNGKPWPTKNGNKSRMQNKRALVVRAFALHAAEFTKQRSAEILGLLKENGGDYEKTLGRYVKEGQFIIHGNGIVLDEPQPGGEYHYRAALDELIADFGLTTSERQKLSQNRDELQALIDYWTT